MSSCRQRTKQLTNLILERIDELIEILEIQFEVKISIRSTFESRSFFFQSTTDVQNVVFLSKNVNMLNVIKDFIKQIKQKLLIIKIEKKKRVYLRHRLIQMKTKKNLIFLSLSSRYRTRFEKMSNFKQRQYHWKRI